MLVLGISGSLRRGSYNTALLRHASDVFEAEGAGFEIDDELRSIPPFDEDEEENEPPAVARFRAAVAAADAVLFATPEYNSSIPGELKNALDWLSRPLATNPMRNKPAAVIGASIGAFGAVWAQADLRKVLGAMGARVVEGELAVGHVADRFDDHGRLNDPNLEEQLGEVVRALILEALAREQSMAGDSQTPAVDDGLVSR
jgi:chromate reductase, NAD(P)H dehydrogenase (quinone)